MFWLLRNLAPILVVRRVAIVTRYDDVREVFMADDAFMVPYRLGAYVFEAMRFDPLAPYLARTVVKSHVLAAGTRRATALVPGTRVLVSFASAMMDGRRIRDPGAFDPTRPSSSYIHFGQGLHECFGI